MDLQYISSSKVSASERSGKMEAIFLNQSSNSAMSCSSEILEEDPLSSTAKPKTRKKVKNSSQLKPSLSSVRRKLPQLSESGRADDASLRAKRKPRDWQHLKDPDFEPRLTVKFDAIVEGKPLSLFDSRQCIQRRFVAVDPSKPNGLRQFSLKKTLLQGSELHPASFDVNRSSEQYPLDDEQKPTVGKKFTNRILLPRPSLKSGAESSARLPTIVALISVKKPTFKRKKTVKSRLPKKSWIETTLPKQSTSEVDNKVQVSLKITTSKQTSLKKAPRKASPLKETSFKQSAMEVDKKERDSKKVTILEKRLNPTEVPKSECSKPECSKAECSLSKAVELVPTMQDSDGAKPAATIPCTECSRLFVSYRSRARHFRCHKVPMTYSCTDCPRSFNNRTSFLCHAKTHSKAGWIACTLCPAKFAWPNTFRAHLLGHVGRLRDPLCCLVCTKKFWYQQTWDQHASKGQCRRKKLRERQPLQCDICQKLVTTRGNLKKHLAMHQGLKPFVCTICNVRFTARSSLNEHFRIHSGHRPFVCHVCGKSFAQSSGFRQHLAIHSRVCNFVCKLCDKGFKLNRYLAKHMETMHVEDSKYNCHHCGKLFKLGDYLRRHIKAVHSQGSEPHARRPATEEWDSNGESLDGERSDGERSGEERSDGECSDGELGYEPVNEARTQEDNYQEAVLQKGDENSVIEDFVICELSTEAASESVDRAVQQTCDIDDLGGWSQDRVESFQGRSAVRVCRASVEPLGGNEQRTNRTADARAGSDILKPSGSLEPATQACETVAIAATAEDQGPSEPPALERRSRVRPFSCPVCAKSFRKPQTLDAHMGSHSQLRPFECDVCRHRFNTKQEVRRHLQSHGVNSADQLRCSLCGKVHLRLVDRERHVCGATRLFGCTKCGAKFERRQQLQRHVGEEHKSSLECKLCGKVSTTSWNLKKHMSVHTGEKPFVCEVCGARFTANQSLKVHAACHVTQDRRPYVCSVCAKTFTQKSSMRQHEMLHDNEPRHKCNYCDKKFKVASYLRRHIAVLHTTDKRFSCADCGKRYGLRSTLLVHEQSHSERPRLQCQDCDKTFSDKRYLRKHANKEHGDAD